MPLPIDFEKIVKLPAGNGYPYSLKSEDLMKNFAWCDLLPSDSTDEIRIELEEVSGVTARHAQRRLKFGGTGEQGDMLYFDSSTSSWVRLAAPSPSGLYVLTHDGSVPSWASTSECT